MEKMRLSKHNLRFSYFFVSPIPNMKIIGTSPVMIKTGHGSPCRQKIDKNCLALRRKIYATVSSESMFAVK